MKLLVLFIVQIFVLEMTTAWSSFTAKQVDIALDSTVLRRITTRISMSPRHLTEDFISEKVKFYL